jgi:hypothetical protein
VDEVEVSRNRRIDLFPTILVRGRDTIRCMVFDCFGPRGAKNVEPRFPRLRRSLRSWAQP